MHKPLTSGTKHKKGGFTVIEAVISFSILTLSLTGFSGMVVSSLKSFRTSQDKYVAAKIAQEGMELAQNKKDNHVQCVAANVACPISNWQTGLVGDWEVASDRTPELLPSNASGNSFHVYNAAHYICSLTTPVSDAGNFGYCASGYLTQKYTREVRITSLNSYSISVVTTVHWGTSNSLVLQSVLFSEI